MARKKAKALPPKMITVYAEILQETELAILVRCDEDADGAWLPKSQIKYDGERGDTGVEIEIPELMADEKGFFDGMGRPEVEAAPVPAEPEQPETAMFYGYFNEEDLDENGVVFTVEYDDAAVDFTIPRDQIIEIDHNEPETGNCCLVIVSRAYAIEAGMMESPEKDNDPPAQPETYTFYADVEHVYAGKYVLLVTAGDDKTASLEFGKEEVTYEGQDTADLQEGYRDIEFTIPWDLAVEKHLPELFGEVDVPPVATVSPDDDENGTPQTSLYRHKLRTATITDYVELSDAEKITYGKDLVKYLESEADYKSAASDYSARARGEKKRADKIVDILSAGREERSIDCDVVADYNRDQLVYVESEWPHREIRRERLTEKDRQLTLFDTGIQPAAPKVEESATPADAPEETPAESELVVLMGELTDNDGESVYFLHQYGAGEEDELAIPLDAVIEMVSGKEDTPDSITISHSFAVERGIIDAAPAVEEPAPTDAEPERSCGTCAHIHETPEGDDASPCADCGSDDLPNYVPIEQTLQPAAAMQ